MRELKLAWRSLRRAPLFAVLAIGTLGLAIGVNAGIFSVVQTVLLDPLPFQHTDRLVTLSATAPGTDLPDEFGLGAEFYFLYQEESELIESIALFNNFTSTLRANDRIERISMSAPTPSLFETLGVEPLMGRLPTAEDEGGVVLLSHTLWTTWFGSDPDVLGKTYHVSGEDRTVIGVMPESFWFPTDGALLWFPNTMRAENVRPGRFGLRTVARLAPGASLDALAAELDVLHQRLPDRVGGSPEYVRVIEALGPIVRPLETYLLGDVSAPIWILFASLGLVLLIACANVANLLMVRAERRQSDQAVRLALGAARGRLLLGQLAETGIIAAAAGALAVVLAWAGVPLLIAAAPQTVPRLGEVAIGPETLAFTFLATLLAALLCGLAPAIRFSSPKLARLREGGRGMMRRRHWGRQTLVVAQTAMALVLLIGSALLFQSFDRLRDVDPGYDTEDLFTFQIAPEGEHLHDAPTYARFHTEFSERVASLPGVESVGLVENVPLDEGLASGRFVTEDTVGAETGALLSFTYSGGDYFRTAGIEVFEGRPFGPDDHTTQLGNVLVSRSAAEMLWPGESAVGKRVRMQEAELWETVVGVVDDVLQYGFRQQAEPMLYFSLVGQDPENRRTLSSPGYMVKTPRASEIGPEIRALVREVAPTAPMYRTYTMAGLAEDSMVQLSFSMLTIGIAAVLALILGMVGLYGVLSYAVAERTREIGLRMALGAEARRVRMMIVAQGARVLAIGLALGLGIALLATRSLDGLLFGIEAFDPATYAIVAVLTVLVGLAASYAPARRASKVDPMESLRIE